MSPPLQAQVRTVLRLGLTALLTAMLVAVWVVVIPWLSWAGIIGENSWPTLHLPPLLVLAGLWLAGFILGVRACALAARLHRQLREQEAETERELPDPTLAPAGLRAGWALGGMALVLDLGSVGLCGWLMLGAGGP